MKRAGIDIFQSKKYKPPTRVIIRETSIKTMRYSLVSVKLAITQRLKVGMVRMRHKRTLCTVSENISYLMHYGRQYEDSLKT